MWITWSSLCLVAALLCDVGLGLKDEDPRRSVLYRRAIDGTRGRKYFNPREDGFLDDYGAAKGRYRPEEAESGMFDIRNNVPGEPGVDYPIYTTLPQTRFSCEGRARGYYADEDAGCQVFHVCHDVVVSSFLCPVGSIFNQKLLTCDWWSNVDCDTARLFYVANEHLYDRDDDDEMIRKAYAMTRQPLQVPATTRAQENHRPDDGAAGNELTSDSFDPEVDDRRKDRRFPGFPGGSLMYDDYSYEPSIEAAPNHEAEDVGSFQTREMSPRPADSPIIRIHPLSSHGRSAVSAAPSRNSYGDRADVVGNDFQPSYAPTVPTVTTTTRRLYSPTVPTTYRPSTESYERVDQDVEGSDHLYSRGDDVGYSTTPSAILIGSGNDRGDAPSTIVYREDEMTDRNAYSGEHESTIDGDARSHVQETTPNVSTTAYDEEESEEMRQSDEGEAEDKTDEEFEGTEARESVGLIRVEEERLRELAEDEESSRRREFQPTEKSFASTYGARESTLMSRMDTEPVITRSDGAGDASASSKSTSHFFLQRADKTSIVDFRKAGLSVRTTTVPSPSYGATKTEHASQVVDESRFLTSVSFPKPLERDRNLDEDVRQVPSKLIAEFTTVEYPSGHGSRGTALPRKPEEVSDSVHDESVTISAYSDRRKTESSTAESIVPSTLPSRLFGDIEVPAATIVPPFSDYNDSRGGQGGTVRPSELTERSVNDLTNADPIITRNDDANETSALSESTLHLAARGTDRGLIMDRPRHSIASPSPPIVMYSSKISADGMPVPSESTYSQPVMVYVDQREGRRQIVRPLEKTGRSVVTPPSSATHLLPWIVNPDSVRSRDRGSSVHPPPSIDPDLPPRSDDLKSTARPLEVTERYTASSSTGPDVPSWSVNADSPVSTIAPSFVVAFNSSGSSDGESTTIYDENFRDAEGSATVSSPSVSSDFDRLPMTTARTTSTTLSRQDHLEGEASSTLPSFVVPSIIQQPPHEKFVTTVARRCDDGSTTPSSASTTIAKTREFIPQSIVESSTRSAIEDEPRRTTSTTRTTGRVDALDANVQPTQNFVSALNSAASSRFKLPANIEQVEDSIVKNNGSPYQVSFTVNKDDDFEPSDIISRLISQHESSGSSRMSLGNFEIVKSETPDDNPLQTTMTTISGRSHRPSEVSGAAVATEGGIRSGNFSEGGSRSGKKLDVRLSMDSLIKSDRFPRPFALSNHGNVDKASRFGSSTNDSPVEPRKSVKFSGFESGVGPPLKEQILEELNRSFGSPLYDNRGADQVLPHFGLPNVQRAVDFKTGLSLVPQQPRERNPKELEETAKTTSKITTTTSQPVKTVVKTEFIPSLSFSFDTEEGRKEYADAVLKGLLRSDGSVDPWSAKDRKSETESSSSAPK